MVVRCTDSGDGTARHADTGMLIQVLLETGLNDAVIDAPQDFRTLSQGQVPPTRIGVGAQRVFMESRALCAEEPIAGDDVHMGFGIAIYQRAGDRTRGLSSPDYRDSLRSALRIGKGGRY